MNQLFVAFLLLGVVFLAAPFAGRADDASKRLVFSAEVDDEAIIYVSHRRIALETDTDEPLRSLNYQFKSTFPRSTVQVYFKSKKGRGKIQITQQPRQENNYTAAIRITDPERARSRYEFVLAWD